LHDDELLTVAISPDGKDIISAGLDKKIYVWSLEAALKAVVRLYSGVSISFSNALVVR
jgi:WD40 repeat protein